MVNATRAAVPTAARTLTLTLRSANDGRRARAPAPASSAAESVIIVTTVLFRRIIRLLSTRVAACLASLCERRTMKCDCLDGFVDVGPLAMDRHPPDPAGDRYHPRRGRGPGQPALRPCLADHAAVAGPGRRARLRLRRRRDALVRRGRD